MKIKNKNREGFYMNINSEERKLINRLQEKHAINISQAFKIFLKKLESKLS